MIRILSRCILRIWGWKMVGTIPSVNKYLVIAAPHTSNWDYVIGKLFYLSFGVKAKIMIKKELFYFPLGGILRVLGGIPVDRSKKTDIVDQMIREFKNSDSFILTITPEGTRKKVSDWKTGFHRIATGAGVPVLPGFFDYRKKVVGTGDFIPLSGNLEQDMINVKKFYRDINPKYPENFSVGDIRKLVR
ncbi:MAG: lysophospholipid acyltransferase family protein [Bacteroidales bacterium]